MKYSAEQMGIRKSTVDPNAWTIEEIARNLVCSTGWAYKHAHLMVQSGAWEKVRVPAGKRLVDGYRPVKGKK